MATDSPADGSILVVDDNDMNRDMLSRRLARRGYTVELAASGNEAIERIEGQPFDVVFLDVMMPGTSGLDVLRRARERFALNELPIIMATAKDDSDDIVEALELGANDYVTKPFDFAVVLARVRTQLDLKRSGEQVARLEKSLAQLRTAGGGRRDPQLTELCARWSTLTAERRQTILDLARE